MAKKINNCDVNNANNHISASTPIIFTLKGFVALIGTILTIFFGFYQLVIVPKVNETKEHYEMLFKDQKEQNRLFYEELSGINATMNNINTAIITLGKDGNVTTPTVNTSGSLGELPRTNRDSTNNNRLIGVR